jgi:hypothetical protein
MKNNPDLFETWKIYIKHVSDPITVLFVLYYKQMFNNLPEFYYFGIKEVLVPMGEFILASQFLKCAHQIL